MKKFSPTELSQANQLGQAVGRAMDAVARAREQLDNSLKANVGQDSEWWLERVKTLNDAFKQLNQAVGNETDWWRAQGFNV